VELRLRGRVVVTSPLADEALHRTSEVSVRRRSMSKAVSGNSQGEGTATPTRRGNGVSNRPVSQIENGKTVGLDVLDHWVPPSTNQRHAIDVD